ncbi:MAG: hypothetical protein ACE141_05875 [Bryobacteraceae bacterium]
MKLATIVPLALLATAAAAELPVRQVILYKHGIGYFERGGELAPGETARLDFKPSEMDDVLKSLTIQDPGGGRITGVRYDSSQPLARRLEDFPFRLGERQPLSAFLDTLKGARVDVRVGPETITGAVVSARQTAAAGQQPEREWLTLLVDSGDLRTVDLSSATSLRFRDNQIQERLKEYLTILSGARSREDRSVFIDSTESRQRQIVASYVIPMPVWKSTYRLIFGPSGAATLEGWAIVDNITGEDWSGVKLSVVSGRPISFVSRLYEPRYLPRPEAQLPEERAQAPVVHQGAVGGLADTNEEAKFFRKDRAMAAPRPALAAETAAPSAGLPREAASSVAPSTEARELGELFEYSFSTPVTVRRGESAMLPFLQQKVTARKLLIYSDPASQNPMNAVELTNDTGKALDGGPVTVYETSAYAGEALMETLKASDRRLVSYAVDLGTRVTTQFESTSNTVREIHFRRGILTTRQAAQETRTYTIRNVDQKPKVLILEHPARPGYQLVNLKPAETTATAWRFEIKLAAGAIEKFPVTEERVFDSTYAIANLTPDVLASYVQNKALSETARAQLEKIAQQKRLIAETDASLTRTEREISDMANDQSRLRQNIDSLNRVAGQQEQVQQYARQLAAQETQLAAARDRQAGLRKNRAALESELNSLIEKMEF